MHQTIIVAVYSPLAIVGMMLVITWGINAAGARREGHGQAVSQQIELCDICPMRPFAIQGAGPEVATLSSGYVGENYVGTLKKLRVERSYGSINGIAHRPVGES